MTIRKIYDISQPLFECAVFPGDEPPVRTIASSMDEGAFYNLTELSMCAHNGTHVDAPFHFINTGKGIDEIDLTRFIGPAFVAEHEGDLLAADAKAILKRAAQACPGAEKKLLLKGNLTVTAEAAQIFADAGIDLIGNESQTVGPLDAPMAVHLILLGAEVVLLEGIRLADVPEGVYLLNCAPLNLTHADGAPCRAVLLDIELS
ncbi:MAG: cyclase family protein [Lachnospiraceae bacterium]|nr:cyclase family protein [Lachnospiraceae bacterium]